MPTFDETLREDIARIYSTLPLPNEPFMRIDNRNGTALFNGNPSEIPGKVLDGAILHYAYLTGQSFKGCSLKGATFAGATISRCNFTNADLTGANFTDALAGGADFTGAKYNGDTIPGWKTVGGLLERKPDGECLLCERTEEDYTMRHCGACESCCGHRQCSDCDECHDQVCTHCDECSDCCSCDICTSCCNLQQCSDCDSCRDCCSCSDDSDDDDSDHQAGKPWDFKPGSKFKCRRMVGVEWEFNRMVDLSSWRQKWRGGVHHDGSCGYEAVTPPIAGDHIENCLKDLAKTFKEESAESDDRCGIHVHVDARDLKWADMYRLLWVYSKVEPMMYLLAGQHRAKVDRDRTSYCKPVGKEFLDSLSEVDRKGAVLAVALGRGHSEDAARKELRLHRIHKKDGGRYRGLNIIPWLVGRAYKEKRMIRDKDTGRAVSTLVPKSDSTVEFRMHRNTLLGERVVGWTQLCAKLVDWCANATDKEAQNLPKSALRALCEVIAPESAPWILHRVKEWRKATRVGPVSKKRRIPRRISLTDQGYKLKVAA